MNASNENTRLEVHMKYDPDKPGFVGTTPETKALLDDCEAVLKEQGFGFAGNANKKDFKEEELVVDSIIKLEKDSDASLLEDWGLVSAKAQEHGYRLVYYAMSDAPDDVYEIEQFHKAA